jgi:uncharacterized protein with HEPN domain
VLGRAWESIPDPNFSDEHDFRNRIIHGYDSVDDVIVWRTVQHHLPALKAEVEELLGEDEAAPGERSGSPATP